MAWKTLRVFISSTFRDMQAERDYLVRFVFPALREKLLRRRIHLVDVDLRWGVTSDEDASEVCREVIDECRPLFLCLLGGRYGWVPDGKAHSITADEIYYGVLHPSKPGVRALFYFRDPEVTAAMAESEPGEFRESAGSANEARLADLKADIVRRGHSPAVYRGRWDADGARLVDLEQFGERVISDIMAAIDAELGGGKITPGDEFAEERAAMEAFVEERTHRFVLGARQSILDGLLDAIDDPDGNPVVCLTGDPGSGKSALLGMLAKALAERRPEVLVVSHFVGASAASSDIRRMVTRILREIYTGCDLESDLSVRLGEIERRHRRGLEYEGATERRRAEKAILEEQEVVRAQYEIPADPDRLRRRQAEFLDLGAQARRIVVLIDAVNQLGGWEGWTATNWLPLRVPPGVKIVVSTAPGAALDHLRGRCPPAGEVVLPVLTAKDAGAIVTGFLNRYHKKLTAGQHAALLAKPDSETPLYLLAALEELRTSGDFEAVSGRIAELPGTTRELFAAILRRLELDPGFRDAGSGRGGADLVRPFGACLAASRHGLSQRELGILVDPGDPRGNVAALVRLLRPYLMLRGELLDFYHGQFRAATEGNYLGGEAEFQSAHGKLVRLFQDEADPAGDRSWAGADGRPFSELPFHLGRHDPGALSRLLLDFGWLQRKCGLGLTYEAISDYTDALNVLPADDPNRGTLEVIRSALLLSGPVIANDPRQLGGQLIGRMSGMEREDVSGYLELVRGWRGSAWLMPTAALLHPPGTALVRTMAGHLAEVDHLLVTRDGGRLISCSHYDLIKLWDIENGVLLHTFAEASAGANQLILTPDDRRLISASRNGALYVWDLESGSLAHTLVPPPTPPYEFYEEFRVGVTPDSRRVIGAGQDGALKVWDLETGEDVLTLTEPLVSLEISAADSVGSEAEPPYSPTGPPEPFAPPSNGGEQRGRVPFHLPPDPVSPEGEAAHDPAFAGSDDDGVFLDVDDDFELDLSGDESFELPDIEIEPDPCEPIRLPGRPVVSVNSDGSRAISLHNGTLTEFDLTNGSQVRQWEVPEFWRLSGGTYLPGDDSRVLLSGWDHSIWDLESGQSILKFRDFLPDPMSTTADGRWMVGCVLGSLKLWDLVARRRVRIFGKRSGKVDQVAFCRDQIHFVAADHEGTLRIWNRRRRRAVREFEGIRVRACSMVLLPDGKRALTGMADGRIHLWDLEHPGQRRRQRARGAAVGAVAFSGAGAGCQVLAAAADGEIMVWKVPIGIGNPRVCRGHTKPVAAMAVATDCGLVVTAGEDKLICLWDVRSKRVTRRFEYATAKDAAELGFTDSFTKKMAVAISADGERVVSCAGGYLATVLVSRTGKIEFNIGPLPLYEAPDAIPREPEWGDFFSLVADETEARFRSVALSGDGTVAVFGMDDGTVRVWDLTLRAELRTLVTEGLDTGAVALTADGGRVAALAGDALTVWDVGSGEIVFRQSSGKPAGPATGMTMDRDGWRVVASYGKSVTVWFPSGETGPATFTGEREMLSCALTADGKAVVAGDEAGDLHWLEIVLPGSPLNRPPASEVTAPSWWRRFRRFWGRFGIRRGQ